MTQILDGYPQGISHNAQELISTFRFQQESLLDALREQYAKDENDAVSVSAPVQTETMQEYLQHRRGADVV